MTDALPHEAVPLVRLSGGLLRARLEERPEIAALAPTLPAGPEEVVREVGDRAPASAGTVAAIVASMEAMMAPPPALTNAAALGREGTLAVVAGQQPGLLGGPLFTWFKALGAIRAAAALDAAEAGSGRRWVPVFWNASEDHDLDEVNAVVLPDGEGRPRRLRAAIEPDGRACRDVSADDEAFDVLLDEVEALLPGGPGREAVRSWLRAPRGASIASWFSRLLLRVLGRHGLVVVEPDHVREATVGIMEREIAEPGRLTEAVRGAQTILREAGLVPVLAADREVNLFVYHEGRRRAIVREGDGFGVEGEEAKLSGEELLERIRTTPREFSTNVALRPLVQDAAFPVGVQLAGPTELAYLAELGPAHDDAGIPRPLVLPRPSATLVEPRAAKALGRLELAAARVVEDPSRLEVAVAGEEEETSIRRRVEALRDGLAPALDDLLGESGPEGSGTRRKAVRLVGHLLENLTKLERTVVEARRTERGAGRRHVDRIRNALRPTGRPQERVYGLVPYLARHGFDLVDRILATLDPFAYEHRVVMLG
jgi:bacillithiol biosynthesis cysteine-adding enzyme BshC